jgi:hypothetical protein
VSKYLILLIFICSISFARDKQLAEQYSNELNSYYSSIKSSQPNSAVVFISSRIDPDYMDIQEVPIDSTDLSDGKVLIERPLYSLKIKPISYCKSEMNASVTINFTNIEVVTDRFPVRIICYSENGNYREAYSTMNK